MTIFYDPIEVVSVKFPNFCRFPCFSCISSLVDGWFLWNSNISATLASIMSSWLTPLARVMFYCVVVSIWREPSFLWSLREQIFHRAFSASAWALCQAQALVQAIHNIVESLTVGLLASLVHQGGQREDLHRHQTSDVAFIPLPTG